MAIMMKLVPLCRIILLLVLFTTILSLELSIAQSAQDYIDKGMSKSILGDNKGAIQDFSKAIELKPNSAIAYKNRGLLKIDLGRNSSGCLDLSKAGELVYRNANGLIKEYCK
jgi:tetratricopeptide (TPR) repeat protein